MTCYAEIIKVGTTSITVKVESWVRRGTGEEHIVVTEGIPFTYVAVGSDRRPRPVPPKLTDCICARELAEPAIRRVVTTSEGCPPLVLAFDFSAHQNPPRTAKRVALVGKVPLD